MTTPRRGRPRSSAVHDAILNATRVLLIENGYGEVSMERVAARAGVGRQTLYRRWPSKAPLVAEAVMDATYRRDGSNELADTGDVAADLGAWLHENAAFFVSPDNAALIRALAAAAAHSPLDAEALYRQLTGPQHGAITQRLQQGVDVGQVRPDADLEAVADALIGAILYRILTRATAAEETVRHFDGLVDALITGLRPNGVPARR